MAKNPNLLNRKVLANLRSQKTNEQIAAQLSGNAAMGEILVQIPEEVSATSLWTLAHDEKTAIQFVNKEMVQEMISQGAVAEVDAIENAVGLSSDGTYVEKSGTNYLNSATTVEGEILALDTALGTLSGYVDNLDYNLAKDENKVVVSVKQQNGAVSATSENITGVKLDGYAEAADPAHVAATQTLGQALGNLQGQIDHMNKSADVQVGKIVTTVSEVSGVVSETKSYLKDVTLSGYTKGSNAGAIADGDTLGDALSKIENRITSSSVASADNSINVNESSSGTDINVNIKSGEHVLAKGGGNGLYTDLKLSALTAAEIAELSDTNVKEAYKLVATDGEQLGDTIKIYKDSSLYSAYLGHVDDAITSASDPTVIPGSGDTALCFIYLKADGTYQLVAVDVQSFLEESEFSDGLQVVNHVVSVKKDASSEKVVVAYNETGNTEADVLTVSSDGVKVANIQTAINAAIAKSEEGLAELSGAVKNEIARAESAETALDVVIGATKGANDESRTYGHSGTNYLDGKDSVKEDAESLDELLGKVSTGDTAYTVDFSEKSVAKNISEIKKALADLGAQIVTVVDDEKYIAASATTDANGNVTIGISGVTHNIASSSANSTGIADAWNVKQYAVKDVKDDTLATDAADINVAVVQDANGCRIIDFTNMVVDCGEF